MKRVVFVLVVVSIGMSNFSKLIAREIIPRDVSYIVQDDRLCLSAKAILDSIKIATEEDTIKLGSRYVTEIGRAHV